MLAVSIHGRDLLAVLVLLGFIAFLLFLTLRREGVTRIVRVGVFIERARYDPDTRPIPPPTPPPPLPRREDDVTWPILKED